MNTFIIIIIIINVALLAVFAMLVFREEQQYRDIRAEIAAAREHAEEMLRQIEEEYDEEEEQG